MSMPPLSKLGIEPLDADFTLVNFKAALAGKTSKIKAVLLNQAYIVGIGNIYVDESLFRAGIHPEQLANTLTDEQFVALHQAVIATLSESVEVGGSSIKSYVNGQGEMGMFQHQLKIYGRQNQPCVNCGTLIEKSVVGGRGTHFCPVCQTIK